MGSSGSNESQGHEWLTEHKSNMSDDQSSSSSGDDQDDSCAIVPRASSSSVLAKMDDDKSPGSREAATTTFNMTGVTGGTVDRAYVAGIVEGGMGNTTLNTGDGSQTTLNITYATQQDDGQKRTDVIKKRTIEVFQAWDRHMVRTAALDKVLDKLNSGTTWLTIKGNPGEGKTTVGYMALEELHRCGRQVFEVRSPDEFTEVIGTCSHPVVMLDDVFGNLEFDQIKWSNWEPVVSPLLKKWEHKSHVNEVSQTDRNVTVILTGRDYVLNSASVGLGRLSKVLTSDKHVVCMDHNIKRSFEEKHAIWESISRSSGVELQKTTVDKILRIDVPHGFPHVCRLFVTIFKDDDTISAVEFFSKPLAFLNDSISNLFKDINKVMLFKEMVKGEGRISKKELRKLDPSYRTTQEANSLEGIYIKDEDGCFVFDHPSIYDSVAFHLCSLDPEFVIQQCHLSFIHERVRIRFSKDTGSTNTPGSCIVVFVDKAYSDDLAERFAAKIMKQNLVQVLSHQAFSDGEFVRKAMSKIKTPLRRLFYLTDQGYCSSLTFLSFVPSSRSPELLKYIDNSPGIELTEDEDNDVLYGTCKYAASQVLTYLVSTRRSLDINKKFELRKSKTLLMIAAQTKDDQSVHQILSLNPDLDARDETGKTALHYLCENGLVSAVTHVIESARGADIDAEDRFGVSPLSESCAFNWPDLVKLLIERGAKIHEMSMYECML